MCQASLSSLRELNDMYINSEKKNVPRLDIFWVYTLSVLRDASDDDPIINLMFGFIQLFIIMSVCLVLFTKTCHRQLTQPQHPSNVYTRTYPFHYPKELLILTCYMLHTWFGKLLCRISGDSFEDKIVILVKPKEVLQHKDKKPPGNKKKM